MNREEQVSSFIRDLKVLFEKYSMYIDCHGEFVSFLKDSKTQRVIALLWEGCSPEIVEDTPCKVLMYDHIGMEEHYFNSIEEARAWIQWDGGEEFGFVYEIVAEGDSEE